MQCPGCQKTIADDSKFCQYCGVALTFRSPAPAQNEAAPAPAGQAAPGSSRVAADPANEKPLLEFRPAWRAFFGGWVWWLLLTILACLLLSKLQLDAMWWRTFMILSAAGAVFVFIRQALSVLGVRYRLTTQRLFIERGLLSRTIDQTELVRVDDVRVSQGMLERMLNIGRIKVISSDKTDQDFVIGGCEEPGKIAEEIRKSTRLMRSRQTMYVENV